MQCDWDNVAEIAMFLIGLDTALLTALPEVALGEALDRAKAASACVAVASAALGVVVMVVVGDCVAAVTVVAEVSSADGCRALLLIILPPQGPEHSETTPNTTSRPNTLRASENRKTTAV